VGEVPALRASVDCGCVEFCLVWTKKDVDATCGLHILKHGRNM
jgi:hypothetical protein